ncbi:MAG: hypothetical protein Q7V63_03550 [Gammaproteobacteria bacterium]|nr:hypothetical protein [Gammaproteobacteria bacterium]
MYKVNSMKKSILCMSCLSLLMATLAFADSSASSTNPWLNSNSSGQTDAVSAPSTSSFITQQNQSYQTMQKQLQQSQQTYVNTNSLNPSNYNLPLIPSNAPSNPNLLKS